MKSDEFITSGSIKSLTLSRSSGVSAASSASKSSMLKFSLAFFVVAIRRCSFMSMIYSMTLAVYIRTSNDEMCESHKRKQKQKTKHHHHHSHHR
jgi:hypothetical protein